MKNYQNKNILIIGSSWGQGEFCLETSNKLAVAHTGIEHFLSEYNKVTNLSSSSYSDWGVLDCLSGYFTGAHRSPEDLHVFILQGDLMMSSKSSLFDIDYDKIISESGSLIDFYRSVAEIYYMKLNDIINFYNIKNVNLIGATTDVETDLVKQFKNINVLVPSWIKLLDEYHVPSLIPLVFKQKFVTKMKNLQEEIFEVSDKNYPYAKKLMDTAYFGPVPNDFHPSRHGHKILADFIKDRI